MSQRKSTHTHLLKHHLPPPSPRPGIASGHLIFSSPPPPIRGARLPLAHWCHPWTRPRRSPTSLPLATSYSLCLRRRSVQLGRRWSAATGTKRNSQTRGLWFFLSYHDFFDVPNGFLMYHGFLTITTSSRIISRDTACTISFYSFAWQLLELSWDEKICSSGWRGGKARVNGEQTRTDVT
jgi:hypothetical protein